MNPGTASSSVRMYRYAATVAIGLGLLATLLAGCGQSAAALTRTSQASQAPSPAATLTATPPPPVGAVRIATLPNEPSDRFPVLNKTVTSAAPARQLLAVLLALPAYPTYTMYCPLDTGYMYQLAFYGGGAQVFQASVNPSGCQAIWLQTVDHRWGANDPSFWRIFAATFGVSVTTFGVS